jgi:hypothetical protein
MIIGNFDTRIAEAQLRLLFHIESIFNRRGRKVATFENPNELLFDPSPIDAFDKYYSAFNSSSFRRIIGLIANNREGLTIDKIKDSCSDLKEDKIAEVLEKAAALEIINSRNQVYTSTRPVNFGTTFEWYVCAVCVNELSSIAYWGVNVENLTGDYDVILVRENQIGYIECKSGRLGNIDKNDIKYFLERERVLAPQFSIYLVDGISRDSLKTLVDYALEQKLEYSFEIPSVMDTTISLETEDYKNFVRLIPINSFFVSVRQSLTSTLKEIYEFLTLVCDRTLPTENMAAKGKFR